MITRGFHHNTLALTISECMGPQWASRLATDAKDGFRKGSPLKRSDFQQGHFRSDILYREQEIKKNTSNQSNKCKFHFQVPICHSYFVDNMVRVVKPSQ